MSEKNVIPDLRHSLDKIKYFFVIVDDARIIRAVVINSFTVHEGHNKKIAVLLEQTTEYTKEDLKKQIFHAKTNRDNKIEGL